MRREPPSPPPRCAGPTNQTVRDNMNAPASRVRAAKGTRRRRTITPDDLLRVQFVSDARIAPDGQRIAFVHKHIGDKNDYRTNLWMVDVGDPSSARAFTHGDKDRYPRWSPDGSTLAFISSRGQHHAQVHLIDAGADGGEARTLTTFPEGTIRDLKWSPDGSRIAVSFRETAERWTERAARERRDKGLTDPPRITETLHYRLDGDGYFEDQHFRLFIVDVATGEHRMVYDKDTLGYFDYDFAPDGRKLVIATNRHRRASVKKNKSELLVLDLKSGKLKEIPNLPEGVKTSPRWSPDGKNIAYAGRAGRDGAYSTDNLEVWICDPAKGAARSLTGRTDYCLMAVAIGDMAEASYSPNLLWTPDSRHVCFQLGWQGETQLARVARRGGEVEILTRGTHNLEIGNCTADGTRFAAVRVTPTVLPEVVTIEPSGDGADITAVTGLNAPLLGELKLGRMKAHWVRTEDGTKCHTWVITPPDFKPGGRKKYPAVLEIHGGPHGQYGVGFFHEFQVLAAAGYVVVFSNPRGSKGYGRDHCAAIRGAWGTADWVDIHAVTKFMQELPFVDASRMGVMGGSYGGYMTNWVISHCHDFRAAITDRCVSNLVSKAGNSDYAHEPDDYHPGNFWDRPEARWKQSPIAFFGNVKTPTLVIHSEGDLRCNIEQGEQVYTALKLRSVPARMVRYPRSTSHGMSRNGPPDMRLHRLGEILAWWAKYLQG
jgi:dipeptidyl aminopeptidase/acylaminoacyl peptidase